MAVLLCGTAATAGAASSYAPPAGWPALGNMALGLADFDAGAKVRRQGYVKPDTAVVAEYDRVFRDLTVKLGGKRLAAIENDILLQGTADDAEITIGALRAFSLLGPGEIAKQFGKESGLKVTYTKASKPVLLGAGDNSVGVLIRIGTRVGEVRFVFGMVRIGQINSFFYFASLPRGKVGIPEAKRLARLSVAHIRATLVPASTAPPTITGTAQAGQTLNALPGTWLSFPTSYAYQWQRCDTSGANCQPIVNATGLTYVVAPEDVGATITIVVTAQNPYGTGTATSTATTVVTAAPSTP